MIILPSEKRINWQQPPWVLISLVVLNVLIFAVYQSGDDEKFEQAQEMYVAAELLTLEKDQYLDYLISKEFDILYPDRFIGFKSLIADQPKYLIPTFLQDRGFYYYLITQQDDWQAPLSKVEIELWQTTRTKVNEKIATISANAAGLIPAEKSFWTAFSSQFLHGSFMHLLGNMIFLVICGFAVEAALGHLRFLIFYLLTGLGGGFLFASVELMLGDGLTPAVGASGAISGVMAMYVTLFRLQKIEFFYWLLMFVGYFRAPALLILPFYIGNELISFWQNDFSGIAYMDHIGGFITGALLVGFTLLQKPEAIDQEYLQQDQNDQPEKKSLDKVYQLIENYQFNTALKKLKQHITEYGESSESDTLQFNLLLSHSQESSELRDYSLILLQQNNRNDDNIKNQLKVWQTLNAENKAHIYSQLTNTQLIQLALHFCQIREFLEAEQLAQHLIEQPNKEMMLAKLLRNIGQFYHDNAGKHKFYQDKMQEVLSGENS